MKKLIIADDEKVLIKGIQKMIPLEELQLELAVTASDGRELYEKIKEHKPDIVITDVKMPKMTGIEVMKTLKEEGEIVPEFVFISGYQEFEYIKEAIQEGAVDYLIKPVNTKDFSNALKKAINKIEKSTVFEIFNKQKDVDSECISESIDLESEEFDEQLLAVCDSLDMSGDKIVFVGLTVGITPESKKQLKEQSLSIYQLKKFAIISKLYEKLKAEKQAFILKNEEEYCNILCVFDGKNRNNYFESIIQPIRSELEEEYEIDLRFGFGKTVTRPDEIKTSCIEAKYAYDLYFFEEKTVIFYHDVKEKETVPFEDYNEGLEKVIKSVVSKDGGFLKNVDMLLMLSRKVHYGNAYAIKARVMFFTGDIIKSLISYKLIKTDFYTLQDELQKELEEKSTFREVHNCVMKFYEKLAAEIYQHEKGRDKGSIERAKKYIKENYKYGITLKELAKIASISESYFSSLFKNETGKTYNSYVNDLRLEEAVRLMMTTEMKVYEIGFEVGYNNTRRFFARFKEKFGVSPSEYRRKVQNEKKDFLNRA
ncbi:MAG: response regulator [Parasporobacterium sp.]|nr:response regulator [Parasporobacterium sp.]